MSTPKSVSGVLGVCRVGLLNPTQPQAATDAGFRVGVLGVSGFRVRGRACVKKSGCIADGARVKKSLREGLKTLQTRHTQHREAESIVFEGFFVCRVCVGLVDSVSGCSGRAAA